MSKKRKKLAIRKAHKAITATVSGLIKSGTLQAKGANIVIGGCRPQRIFK